MSQILATYDDESGKLTSLLVSVPSGEMRLVILSNSTATKELQRADAFVQAVLAAKHKPVTPV